MTNNHTRHHHRHHSEHNDSSELFKRQSLGAIKRKKLIEKLLFYIMLLAAIAVLAGVYYVYTVD